MLARHLKQEYHVLAADDGILQELREQTKWLRLLGFQTLKPVLQQALKTDKHRAVYEYSDGKRSSRDVATLAGVSPGWVAGLWPDWIALGICTMSPTQQGRAQHLVRLSQFGVDVPPILAADGATAAGAGKTKGGRSSKRSAQEVPEVAEEEP